LTTLTEVMSYTHLQQQQRAVAKIRKVILTFIA